MSFCDSPPVHGGMVPSLLPAFSAPIGVSTVPSLAASSALTLAHSGTGSASRAMASARFMIFPSFGDPLFDQQTGARLQGTDELAQPAERRHHEDRAEQVGGEHEHQQQAHVGLELQSREQPGGDAGDER